MGETEASPALILTLISAGLRVQSWGVVRLRPSGLRVTAYSPTVSGRESLGKEEWTAGWGAGTFLHFMCSPPSVAAEQWGRSLR